MGRVRTTLLVVLALSLGQGAGAELRAQNYLTGVLGAGVGLAAGGYLTVGVAVAKSRTGDYVDSTGDILGWETVPVIAGLSVGGAIGLWDAQRLWSTMIGGTVGGAVGTGAGILIGNMVWGDSTGRWAGGVMGGAAGLAVGSLVGLALGGGGDADGADPEVGARGIPVGISIPF